MLQAIGKWSPFHIDALGIVTLLGVEEINIAVGRLCKNHWLIDCLPLLGANLIAANKITKQIPGFTLYNVTDGIVATDVTGWFARWLLSQKLKFALSRLDVQAALSVSGGTACCGMQRLDFVVRLVVALIFMAPIVALTAWMHDWWGLANGLSMLLSVWLRLFVVRQNHLAIASAARSSEQYARELVKIWITLPDGKAVTVFTTRGLVLDCLLTQPRPKNPVLYRAARTLAWVAFACHVVSLGMSTLVAQLISLLWLLTGTCLTAFRVGDCEEKIGGALSIRQGHLSDHACRDTRSEAYARLKLTPKEKDSMISWHLFPQLSNEEWWRRYRLLEERVLVEEECHDEKADTTGKVMCNIHSSFQEC